MKEYFSSIEAFNDLDLDAQIKIYNRFVEAQNRQIRRMRASHPDLLEEFPGLTTLGRRGLPKISRNMAEQYKAYPSEVASGMILTLFQGMRSRVGETGVSVKTAKALHEDRMKMQKEYSNPSITPEEAEHIRGYEKYLKSRSAKFYGIMEYGINAGYWNDYQEAAADLEDRGKNWRYALRSINKYLRDEGRADEVSASKMSDVLDLTLRRIIDRDKNLIERQYERPVHSYQHYDMSKYTRPTRASEARNAKRRKRGKV